MIKSYTFFFTVLVLVATVHAPVANASGCEEVTMVRSKLDAYIVLDHVRRYIDGDRKRFDSAESALKRLDEAIKVADLCGADVEDLKEQLPVLRKKAFLAHAQNAINELREYTAGKIIGTAQWYIALSFDAVVDAKSFGADTRSLEGVFSTLCNSARLTEAKQMLTELEANGSNRPYYVTPAEAVRGVMEAIESAHRGGADVSSLRKRLAQLKQYQVFIKTAQNRWTN